MLDDPKWQRSQRAIVARNAATDTFKVTTDCLARVSQVQELKAGNEKAKTDYTYDLDSNVLSTNAQRGADVHPEPDLRSVRSGG